MQLLKRRRALMAQDKGPTQGLVNGSYNDGKGIVTNNNTITITTASGGGLVIHPIPLITPIITTTSCTYTCIDTATGTTAYSAYVRLYDENGSIIVSSGDNPFTSTNKRPAHYIGVNFIYHSVGYQVRLTVTNDGVVLF